MRLTDPWHRFLDRLWRLHPLIYSKTIWTCTWAASSRWLCCSREAELARGPFQLQPLWDSVKDWTPCPVRMVQLLTLPKQAHQFVLGNLSVCPQAHHCHPAKWYSPISGSPVKEWLEDLMVKKRKKSLKQVGLGLNNNRSSWNLLNGWGFPCRIPDFTSSKHSGAQIQCLSQLSLWRAECWNDFGPFVTGCLWCDGPQAACVSVGKEQCWWSLPGGYISFLHGVIPGCCSHPASHPKLLQERRNFLFLQK